MGTAFTGRVGKPARMGLRLRQPVAGFLFAIKAPLSDIRLDIFMGRLKGRNLVIVVIAALACVALAYWFYARLSCAKNARASGSIESQVYRESVGLSNFSEEKYKGCMRTYGF